LVPRLQPASPATLRWGTFTRSPRLAPCRLSTSAVCSSSTFLDFCAQHSLGADVEVIAAKDVNVAWERPVKNDVRYRFVIDAATI
jgi:hypothetical protein